MAYKFDMGRFFMIFIAVLLMSVLFLYSGFGGLGIGVSKPAISLSASFPFLVLVALALGLGLSVVRVAPNRETEDILTELRCPTCGFTTRRKFAEGDYVTKQDQACPKDGAPMTVARIYVEEPQK